MSPVVLKHLEDPIANWLCALLNSPNGGELILTGAERNLRSWTDIVVQESSGIAPGVTVHSNSGSDRSLEHGCALYVVLNGGQPEWASCTVRVGSGRLQNEVFLTKPFTLRSGDSQHPATSGLVSQFLTGSRAVDCMRVVQVEEESTPALSAQYVYDSVFDPTVMEQASVEKKVINTPKVLRKLQEIIDNYLETLLSSSDNGRCQMIFGVSDDKSKPSLAKGLMCPAYIISGLGTYVKNRLSSLFPQPEKASFSIAKHSVTGWEGLVARDTAGNVRVGKVSSDRIEIFENCIKGRSCFAWQRSAKDKEFLFAATPEVFQDILSAIQDVTIQYSASSELPQLLILELTVSIKFPSTDSVGRGVGKFVCMRRDRTLGYTLDEDGQALRELVPYDYWYLLNRDTVLGDCRSAVWSNGKPSSVWLIADVGSIRTLSILVSRRRGNRHRVIMTHEQAVCRLSQLKGSVSTYGLVMFIFGRSADKESVAEIMTAICNTGSDVHRLTLYVVSLCGAVAMEVVKKADRCRSKISSVIVIPEGSVEAVLVSPGSGRDQSMPNSEVDYSALLPHGDVKFEVVTSLSLSTATASPEDAHSYICGNSLASWFHILLATRDRRAGDGGNILRSPVYRRPCVDPIAEAVHNRFRRKVWCLLEVHSEEPGSGLMTALRLASCVLVKEHQAVCISLRLAVSDILRDHSSMVDLETVLNAMRENKPSSPQPLLVLPCCYESQVYYEELAVWMSDRWDDGGVIFCPLITSSPGNSVSPYPEDVREWEGIAECFKGFVNPDACIALGQHVDETRALVESGALDGPVAKRLDIHISSLCMTAVLHEFRPVAQTVTALRENLSQFFWEQLCNTCFLAFFTQFVSPSFTQARLKMASLFPDEQRRMTDRIACFSEGDCNIQALRSVERVLRYVCQSDTLWHFGIVVMVLNEARLGITETTNGLQLTGDAVVIQDVFERCLSLAPEEVVRDLFIDRDLRVEKFPLFVDLLRRNHPSLLPQLFQQAANLLSVLPRHTGTVANLLVSQARLHRSNHQYQQAVEVSSKAVRLFQRGLAPLNVMSTYHRSIIDLNARIHQSIQQLEDSLSWFQNQLDSPVSGETLPDLLLLQVRGILQMIDSQRSQPNAPGDFWVSLEPSIAELANAAQQYPTNQTQGLVHAVLSLSGIRRHVSTPPGR